MCLLLAKGGQFIITKGKVVKNKFFWDLDGIPSDKLGIANIYAPNECKDRCKL
jgi:hypothetical protein